MCLDEDVLFIIVNKYNIIKIREDFHVVPTKQIKQYNAAKAKVKHTYIKLFALAFELKRLRLVCQFLNETSNRAMAFAIVN